MKRLLLGAVLLFLAVPAYAGGNCIFHKSFAIRPEYVEITEEPEASRQADEMISVPMDETTITPTGDEEPSATPTDITESDTTTQEETDQQTNPSIDSETQTIPLDEEIDEAAETDEEIDEQTEDEEHEKENPSTESITHHHSASHCGHRLCRG